MIESIKVGDHVRHIKYGYEYEILAVDSKKVELGDKTGKVPLPMIYSLKFVLESFVKIDAPTLFQ